MGADFQEEEIVTAMNTRNSPYDAPSCPLNADVVCWPEDRHCDTCGWNPIVAKARLVKICNDMGIELPEILKEEDNHG